MKARLPPRALWFFELLVRPRNITPPKMNMILRYTLPPQLLRVHICARPDKVQVLERYPLKMAYTTVLRNPRPL